MPDQTPVTDDDLRNLREDAETVRNYPGSQRTAVRLAEYVLDTVPAPPATLADEIREEGAGRPPGAVKRVNALADRVEAEVERLTRDLESQALLNKLKQGQVNAARAERDEFQNEMISSERKQAKLEAEVQRLTTELARKEASRQHYVRHAQASSDERDEARAELAEEKQLVKDYWRALGLKDAEVKRLTSIIKNHPYSEFIFAPGGVIGKLTKENLDRMNLPDPADVPEGQPYLVDVEGENEHLLGLRNSGEPHPWETFSLNTLGSGGWCADTDITLVSHLVPDTRRVIDKVEGLDALPAEAVVLSVNTQYVLQHGDGGDGWYGTASTRRATSSEVLARGPVIVLWAPEVSE